MGKWFSAPLLCDFPDECTGSVPNFKIVVIITDLCEMPNISNKYKEEKSFWCLTRTDSMRTHSTATYTDIKWYMCY